MNHSSNGESHRRMSKVKNWYFALNSELMKVHDDSLSADEVQRKIFRPLRIWTGISLVYLRSKKSISYFNVLETLRVYMLALFLILKFAWFLGFFAQIDFRKALNGELNSGFALIGLVTQIYQLAFVKVV